MPKTKQLPMWVQRVNTQLPSVVFSKRGGCWVIMNASNQRRPWRGRMGVVGEEEEERSEEKRGGGRLQQLCLVFPLFVCPCSSHAHNTHPHHKL